MSHVENDNLIRSRTEALSGPWAQQARELLALLRPEINGAASESMRRRGVIYESNLGVALPAIRLHAAKFAPNHQLGKYLYVQPLREWRLSGIYIADPSAIDADELTFWASGIDTLEVGENLASHLLCRSGVIELVAHDWLGADATPFMEYAALLMLSKSLDMGRCPLERDRLVEIVDARRDRSGYVGVAADALAMRL